MHFQTEALLLLLTFKSEWGNSIYIGGSEAGGGMASFIHFFLRINHLKESKNAPLTHVVDSDASAKSWKFLHVALEKYQAWAGDKLPHGPLSSTLIFSHDIPVPKCYRFSFSQMF